jgi:hypothetical protein
MASSEPSRKRGREEVPLPPPAEPKEEPPTPPAKPEEVPSPPPAEPEEVLPPPPAEPEEMPPPPLEEVKRLKPPQRKVAQQPMVPLRAPAVDYSDASFSVKMLYEAWQSLGKLAVRLGVQQPPGPLQMTVMDYTFKVNVLAGYLEREVVPPSTMMRTTMVASTSPAPALTLTLTPTVGLLRRRLPLLN